MSDTSSFSHTVADAHARIESIERPHVRIGYVPLSDAAPLIVADALGLGERHGLTIELCRQPSWAAIRDKLLTGELDAAHSLYGLVYGVHVGIGGPQAEMAALMVLARNGQGITLSTPLADAFAATGNLTTALSTLGRKAVFAQTFPTGTHAMWLYYWLHAQGVHPLRDVECVTIPPQAMVKTLAQHELDGFCVGEPWNALAQRDGAGRTVIASSAIWPDHPEKVLATRADFVARYPNTAKALIKVMLEACRWLDEPGHRQDVAQWLAAPDIIGVPADCIASRLVETVGAQHVTFFKNGTVNYPHVSEGVWFLEQFERWGLWQASRQPEASTNATIAARINQTTLYAQAATELGIEVALQVSPVKLFD